MAGSNWRRGRHSAPLVPDLSPLSHPDVGGLGTDDREADDGELADTSGAGAPESGPPKAAPTRWVLPAAAASVLLHDDDDHDDDDHDDDDHDDDEPTAELAVPAIGDGEEDDRPTAEFALSAVEDEPTVATAANVAAEPAGKAEPNEVAEPDVTSGKAEPVTEPADGVDRAKQVERIKQPEPSPTATDRTAAAGPAAALVPPGPKPPRRGRRRYVLLAIAAVLILVAGAAGVLVLTRYQKDDATKPAPTAAERFGFATDGGADWAPADGRLAMTDEGEKRTTTLTFRYASSAAIDAISGHALEERLRVKTGARCQGREQAPGAQWARPEGPLPAPVGNVPTAAKVYASVEAGRTCDEVVLRVGMLDPRGLEAGTTYRLTVAVDAGPAAARSAALTALRLERTDCDDTLAEERLGCVPDASAGADGPDGPDSDAGNDAELLVAGAGERAFPGLGCRNWYADATTSFPCLPATGARLMTVGSSITSGTLGEYTWRYRLWETIGAAQRPASVGAAQLFKFGDYAVPARKWTSRYDGSPGLTAEQERGLIGRQLAANRPDLLLIHLGTLDLGPFVRQTPARVAAALDGIVRAAQAARPDVTILLAQPEPQAGTAPAKNAQLAELIAKIATTRTGRSVVVPVDLRTGWDPAIHTYDGTNLTPTGEYLTASRFADTLSRQLAYGRRPAPVPGPAQPPAPTNLVPIARPDRTLRLTWNRVPQNTEYKVYMRDLTAREQFRLVQFGLRQEVWTRSLLAPTHVYEMYVTSTISGKESSPSLTSRVTAL